MANELIRKLVQYVNTCGTLQLDDDLGGARLTVHVKLPEGWNHCHIGSDNDPPTDADFAALEAELKALCHANGVRALGPNCLGFRNDLAEKALKDLSGDTKGASFMKATVTVTEGGK